MVSSFMAWSLHQSSDPLLPLHILWVLSVTLSHRAKRYCQCWHPVHTLIISDTCLSVCLRRQLISVAFKIEEPRGIAQEYATFVLLVQLRELSFIFQEKLDIHLLMRWRPWLSQDPRFKPHLLVTFLVTENNWCVYFSLKTLNKSHT